MINLWIFQHYATPPDTVSGTRHFNFAKKLINFGYDVTIFAAGFNHSTLREERLSSNELFRIENIQGVRFVWIKTPKYAGNGWRRMLNMVFYAIRCLLYASQLKQPPRIIFASNPHLFAGLAGYLLSKKYNARFIFEVRDLWPQVFVDIGTFSHRHPLVLALTALEKFIYNQAEIIIVLMKKATRYIESCNIDPRKIVYLPHAIEVTSFENAMNNLPSSLNSLYDIKNKGKFIVGYLGAHGIADSLNTILDCGLELEKRSRQDIHFAMIGHGSEKRRLEERAFELGLRNISFHQAIPKNSVPSVIKLFDLAIVIKKDSPLYKYGTSFIKTFDYMASGVPILWAVNAPDCPVTEAGCGIAVPADAPEKMANAIIYLKEMEEETRNKMGRNGIEYVRKNHDNKALVERLRVIFENL